MLEKMGMFFYLNKGLGVIIIDNIKEKHQSFKWNYYKVLHI